MKVIEHLKHIFGRKSCHEEDHEKITSLCERLCEAQQILNHREEMFQENIRQAIKTIGIFDPKKMMDFYETHKEIDTRPPVIW